ncbi:MAG: N-formylglutamate amidohydrolase [Deltaproteobacteria bacterium]|nr:N-formylglutamate amidohydrolase [Deltaproteobacteria bacterium]
MREWRVVITCEHAGRTIPAFVRREVRIPRDTLMSHRGWDAGALDLARRFRDDLHAPLHAFSITRLVVDANRSPESPEVFSEYSRALDDAARTELLDRHHARFRDKVLRLITRLQNRGIGVIHLSVHSFTPIWKGRARPTDIGILFDPKSRDEAMFARSWMRRLRGAGDWAVHANKPYRGTDDGHTTTLRDVNVNGYVGLEIEINRKFVDTSGWSDLCTHVVATFRDALSAWNARRS